MKYFFAFSLLLTYFIGSCQSHADCNTGYLICDNSSVLIDLDTFDSGVIPNELAGLQDACLNDEFASTWFRWQCKSAGSLSFTITPSDYIPGQRSTDLDFLVFELPLGIDNCTDKQVIRCMASGQTQGCPFDQWGQCNGPTGLSDFSVDVVEEPGCSVCTGGDDDNFLAALNLEVGKAYALVVMNFSSNNESFRIDWEGTATLTDFGIDCEQSNISTTKDRARTNFSFVAYPNPAINTISFKAEKLSRKVKVKVYNSQGTKVTTFKIREEATVDISTLPTGLYYYSAPLDERINGRFVKL